MSTTIVIVSGPPCTGKTHFAKYLGRRLALPLFSRDTIKEAMFESMGYSDRERSKELGRVAHRILMSLLTECLCAGVNCLTEGNFRPHLASGDFSALLTECDVKAVQVQCRANGPTLIERFVTRGLSDARHPGHNDDRNLEEFREELLRGYYDPINIPGKVFNLDNTAVKMTEWKSLASEISTLLLPGGNTTGFN